MRLTNFPVPNMLSWAIEPLKYQAFHVGIARPKHDSASGFFLDLDIYVDLIGSARNRRRFKADRIEIIQPVYARFGTVDLGGRIPASFELTHFPAYDFISSTVIARYIDTPHINPASRIDKKSKRYLSFFLIQLRRCVDIRKSVAVIAQPVGNELDGFGQAFA